MAPSRKALCSPPRAPSQPHTSPPTHTDTGGGPTTPSLPPHPTGPPHSAPRAYFGRAIFAFLRHPVNIEWVRLKPGGGSAPKAARPPPLLRGVAWGRRETPIPKRDGTPAGTPPPPRDRAAPGPRGTPSPPHTPTPTAGRDGARCPPPPFPVPPPLTPSAASSSSAAGTGRPIAPLRSGPAPRPGPAPPRRAVPLGGAAGKRAHGGSGRGVGAWGQPAGVTWGQLRERGRVGPRGRSGALGAVQRGVGRWGCGGAGGARELRGTERVGAVGVRGTRGAGRVRGWEERGVRLWGLWGGAAGCRAARWGDGAVGVQEGAAWGCGSAHTHPARRRRPRPPPPSAKAGR